jgi:hypothetical protein
VVFTEAEEGMLDGVQRGDDVTLNAPERAQPETCERALELTHVVLANGKVVREIPRALRVLRMNA